MASSSYNMAYGAAKEFLRQQQRSLPNSDAPGDDDDDADWRLRDAAQRMLSERHDILPPKSAAPLGGKKAKGADATTLTLAVAPDEFPLDESLHLLKVQKSDVVQAAFSAAAMTILQALMEGGAEGEEEDSSSSSSSDSETDSHPLPHSLLERKQWSDWRQAAFARSLENKEWAKKRGGAAAPAASTASRKRKPSDGSAHHPQQQQQPPLDRSSSSILAESVVSSTEGLVEMDPTGSAAAAAVVSSSSASGPKFTRNTPASSAAALDHRFTHSRAVLCAAGNLVWAAVTANLPGYELEPNDVPQKAKQTAVINLGAVLVDASVYSKRAIAQTRTAVKRCDLRYHYRQQNAKWHRRQQQQQQTTSFGGNGHSKRIYLQLPNLFGWRDQGSSQLPWSEYIFDDDEENIVPHRPNPASISEAWQSFCLPRLQAILQQGSGHVLYHDVQWFSRHGRLAHFLKMLKKKALPSSRRRRRRNDSNDDEAAEPPAEEEEPNYGPHLIVTLTPDVPKFAQEFHDMRSHVPIVIDPDDEEDDDDDSSDNGGNSMRRVLVYEGDDEKRRQLRRHFKTAGSASAESPFHVIVVSYTHFLQDYLHFTACPFEVVILDEGASWMAASQGDPNSSLATVWEQGMWSRQEHAGAVVSSSGGASTTAAAAAAEPWDFSVDTDQISEATLKEACIGLTARHRILTASHLVAENRSSVELLPISGVVSFLAPHFASVVQEEWDRSNIAKDADCMQHFRKLVARSMVVHHESSSLRDMHEMALLGLEGQMGFTERFGDPITPDFISDEDFVKAEKATFSRRACLSWLGTKSVDWLRYELGSANLEPLLNAMKVSTKHGHYCQEITTASSTTSSGATGQVGGTLAYRMAVCCLRHFGSEQGLRQHVSAQHAPPGTWLCRTCGSDCITSQARTHHERTCGQPANGSGGEPGGSVGATPTVGQGGGKGGGGGGKGGGGGGSGVGKKKSQRGANAQAPGPDEKDPDGSLRVPGYRGVWVNKEGKHFIKIDKKRHTGDGDEVMLFDSNDGAARMYDKIITERAAEAASGDQPKLELNFKPDGTRNMYGDATSSTASGGLGGSAANVVPLLSVINIKDLPPDVKPLLRDPRQTSRTGGNSKRHVYAYRGVCRQARKGHDRWQSQISFMGVNHYLGTFDSEWDAAAIYSWAHLILYGEEATKQAQKEGEEAAEAYEQEKRDIAAGRIPTEPPKPASDKAKKPARKKPADKKKSAAKGEGTAAKKRKRKDTGTPSAAAATGGVAAEKKLKGDGKNVSKHEKDALNATLSLGVIKTPVLGEREMFEGMALAELESMASVRLQAARQNMYSVGTDMTTTTTAPATESIRPCLSVPNDEDDDDDDEEDRKDSLGAAMLVGFSPNSLACGWSAQDFCEQNIQQDSDDNTLALTAARILAAEYDPQGANDLFRSVLQGSVCVVGRAGDRLVRHFQELVGTNASLSGRSVGNVDCCVMGPTGSCSSRAACIRHDGTEFQISCLDDKDVVTLNGQRLTSAMDWVTLEHNDVCSVGPRVFVFVLPSGK